MSSHCRRCLLLYLAFLIPEICILVAAHFWEHHTAPVMLLNCTFASKALMETLMWAALVSEDIHSVEELFTFNVASLHSAEYQVHVFTSRTGRQNPT